MPVAALITDSMEQMAIIPRLLEQQAITVQIYSYTQIEKISSSAEVIFAEFNGAAHQSDLLMRLHTNQAQIPIAAIILSRDFALISRAIRSFASDVFCPTGVIGDDAAEVTSIFYRLLRKKTMLSHPLRQSSFPPTSLQKRIASPSSQTLSIEHIEQPVLILDRSDRIRGINSAAQLLMTLSAEEAYGHHIDEYLMLSVDEQKNIRAGKIFRGEFSPSSYVEMNVGYTISPRFDDHGVLLGAMVIFKDITEDKIRRLQAEKAEKMQTLGEIAAAISHEVKNPLAGIKAMVQAIIVDLDPSSEVYQYVAQISQEVSRINKFIEDTFAFARHKRQRIMKVSVHEIVESVLGLLSENLRVNQIDVIKHYEPNLPMLRIDSDQIRQVFLNVIMNAAEAMNQANNGQGVPQKRIEITVHQTIIFTGGETRPYIETFFHDSGPGIPEGVLKKVFDPFFTTKSSGTGLGLAICYKIIHEHQGQIEVMNRRGGGTTVAIRLPVLFLSRFEDRSKENEVPLATNASQNGAQEGTATLQST